MLGEPTGSELAIASFAAPEGAAVTLVGGDALAYENVDGSLVITLPEALPGSHAHAFKVSPS